jgi:hypothetical protein
MPGPVPVLVLGRLAVDRQAQGMKLGAGLLQDAVRRARGVSADAGIRALLVPASSARPAVLLALRIPGIDPASDDVDAAAGRRLSHVSILDTACAPVSHDSMKSRIAEAARRSLSEGIKRMTPEQRLAAFLAHCQLMAQLAGAAGARRRPRRPRAVMPSDAN